MGADGVFAVAAETERKCGRCRKLKPVAMFSTQADGTGTSTCTKCLAYTSAYQRDNEYHYQRIRPPKRERLTSEQIAERRSARRIAYLLSALPATSGRRTVERRIVTRKRADGRVYYMVPLICVCGYKAPVLASLVVSGHAPEACQSCASRSAKLAGAPPNTDRAKLNERRRDLDDVPWEQDHEAQALVAANGEMTLHEIGQYYGISRERVRQIEAIAFRKLREADRASGGQLREVLEYLITRTTQRRGHGSALDWDELPTMQDEPRGHR